MHTYFSQYPEISYNNKQVIDITKNAFMVSNLVANQAILSTYSMVAPLRSDQLSRLFYNDPYSEWLLFKTNQVADPYDSFYMDQTQFYNYIESKYGDYVLAQNTIKYWINNWYSDVTLDIAGYDSLDPAVVKYWTPKYDKYFGIMYYERTKEDWILSTNHLVSYKFTNTIPQFANNESVTITYDNIPTTSNGQVAYCSVNNKQLNINHVLGTYNYNWANVVAANFSIVGSISNSTITISNTNQVSISIYDSVSDIEDVYYDPISVFDYESNLNEAKKNFYYLSNSYYSQAVTELKKAFD